MYKVQAAAPCAGIEQGHQGLNGDGNSLLGRRPVETRQINGRESAAASKPVSLLVRETC